MSRKCCKESCHLNCLLELFHFINNFSSLFRDFERINGTEVRSIVSRTQYACVRARACVRVYTCVGCFTIEKVHMKPQSSHIYRHIYIHIYIYTFGEEHNLYSHERRERSTRVAVVHEARLDQDQDRLGPGAKG